MPKIVLKIKYDGSCYHGWQKQKSELLTIQGIIENTLTKILQQKVDLIGAGRTDKGVHAFSQFAHFNLEKIKYSLNEYQKMFNGNLPLDIRIIKVFKATDNFHARFSVKRKEYVYIFYNHPLLPVFLRKYTLWIKEPLNIDILKQALNEFVGTKDFTSFSSIKNDEINPIRTIDKIDIEKKGHKIYIHIYGKSFLRKMIRMIIGFILDILRGRKTIANIEEVFELKNRGKHNGSIAPAHGLFLNKIWYK